MDSSFIFFQSNVRRFKASLSVLFRLVHILSSIFIIRRTFCNRLVICSEMKGNDKYKYSVIGLAIGTFVY